MTGTEVATVQGLGTLTLQGSQGDWTETQRAALAQIGVADAPRGDQLVLLHVAQRTGLDPFARQIYMIGRKDDDAEGGKKYTIQTGIDGFRVISERHPQYAGVGDAEWCGQDGVWHDVWVEKGPPVAARYTVYRKDWDHPVRAVAHFAEYAQTKYSGEPVAKWRTSPALMIAKCAEALARRRAFPQDLAAVYSDEEMDHVDNPPPVIVPAEREAPPEPDWDALIAHHETAGDLAALGETWKLARGIRPNNSALLDRIAAAAERVKATPLQGEESPGSTGDTPAEKSQTNRLFALLRDGAVSGKDRAVRLRIVSRILNRVPEVSSFDDLTATDIDAVNSFLQRHKDDGVLTHTLVDLGGLKPADEQPETEGELDG
jgi:phage recombination protein Bet